MLKDCNGYMEFFNAIVRMFLDILIPKLIKLEVDDGGIREYGSTNQSGSNIRPEGRYNKTNW